MTTRLPSVLILYNVPGVAFRESDAGVLAEVAAVEAALTRLGGAHRTAGAVGLADVPGILAAAPEEVVFNLVECFPGRPADANDIPVLARAFGKGCTGSGAPCLAVALDKWQTKALLRAADLPTAAGLLVPVGQGIPARGFPKGPVIVKPLASDASEGIDAASVIARPGAALRKAVKRIHDLFRQPALIEAFVGQRELNVSVLERGGRAEVLPIAEIDFSAFDATRPRIVGYEAKWLAESFEYRNTPRILPARLPARVAGRVRSLALATWQALGCMDYARVDFRLTETLEPVVLEVNPNPDISSDAGFAEALTAAGITFDEFVEAVVTSAAARREDKGSEPAPSLSRGALSRKAPDPLAAQGKRRASAAAKCEDLDIRDSIKGDREPIMAAARSTGFFRDDEIVIATEVLDEALAKGTNGHYRSFTALAGGRPVGWVCHGPTPCTLGTFDIYWVLVGADARGRGIGKALMHHAENDIRRRGGRLAIIETNGRAFYEPTRQFYLHAGYHEAARVADFYAPGDDKIVYAKRL